MNLTKKIKKPTYIIKVVSFLFLFSFGANTKIICQNYVFWDLVYSADSAFEKKSYLLAFKKYNICFKMDKRNCHFFENFAYSAVLSGDTKKCISIIKYGIKKYEIDPYHLTKDTTIKSILELKSSSFLKNRIIKLSKYQNDSLRDKLIEIYNSDQKIAIDYKMTNEERKKKNLQNMLSIVEILDSHNWLNKRVVGIRANMTFFLVLQHSTLDYQIKYLDMMRKAVKEGNAESYHLALLEDRIALKNGKRQIYGRSNPKITGNYESKDGGSYRF